MSRIQKKNRHSQLFPRIYAGIFVCMIILLIYLGINQRSAVAQKNPSIESRRVQNVTCTEIQDDSAPAGLRREYILEDIQKEQSNDCLAFYLVHQYAQVYIEDELVYSLTPENAAFVNQDVGCNWVMLPLSQDMVGKQMQIVVTPIYQEVKNRTTEFLIGSRYRISLETVRSDLADILLSIVALGVGIGFMVISLMSLWAITKDPKYGQRDGSLSLKGYGFVGKEFQRLMDYCFYTLNKHIVMVFHAIEDKDGDQTRLRIKVEGQTKNNVWETQDLG